MQRRDDLIPQLETIYKNYQAPVDPEFNLFSIEVPHNLLDDTFSDWLCAWLPAAKQVYIYPGTVNPGASAVQKHEGGAAKVVSGYYPDIWVIDTHMASNPSVAHEAFCQRPQYGVLPIKIYRLDRKGNPTATIQSGTEFGINRHRASYVYDLQKIGPWSEGCSVAQSHKDHEAIMELAKKTDKYNKNHKCKFSCLFMKLSDITL